MLAYLVAELLKEAKYTITEFTMNNRKKLSEFAGLEVELPKIELPEPNIDISSDELHHGDHNIDADDEGAMVKADLYKLAKYSVKLFKKIEDEDQFESWVQAKITKAADYISSVYHYLEYEMKFSEYGDKIENSDMYSESEKRQMKNALMEARKTLAALKIDQADKLEKPKAVKEGVAHTCGECGGTGMVEKPLPEKTEKLVNKHRILRNFVQSKVDANHNGIPDDEEGLGAKPMDDEIISNKPKSKKPAPKKEGGNPFAKKSKDSDSESKDSDSDSESKSEKPKSKAPKKEGGNPFAKKSSESDSSESKPKKSAPKKEKSEKDDATTESIFGGSVYGESAIKRAKSEWKSAKEIMRLAEAKKAKKDYDKDGKIESGEEEHKGAVDNAIKKEKDSINESIELSRLRELTSRVIR